jgi:hypothetical protein
LRVVPRLDTPESPSPLSRLSIEERQRRIGNRQKLRYPVEVGASKLDAETLR